jgi:internalin A
MTDPTPPATILPKRRKRFGLSLRVLMVLVLLLGGGMGWYAYRARVQREAVAAIEAAGGKVYYDWEWNDDRPALPTAKPKWPKWLVDRAGPDYLGNVVAVCFYRSATNKADDEIMVAVCRLPFLQHLDLDDVALTTFKGAKSWITNAGLTQLKSLHRLRNLHLWGAYVTGAGLANLKGMASLRDLELLGIPLIDDDARHLAEFTHLERLSIEGKQFTNAGLAHIAGLTSLKSLYLDCPLLDTSGLESLRGMRGLEELVLNESKVHSLAPILHLTNLSVLSINREFPRGLGTYIYFRHDIDINGIAGLKKLQKLSLPGCNIEDKDFGFLSELVELNLLNLRGTRLGDRGLAGIVGLRKLQDLSLDGTYITDAGLVHISGLSELASLNLARTSISDAGLSRLYGLSKCLSINLLGTKVTPGGVSELQERLPSAKIQHGTRALRWYGRSSSLRNSSSKQGN